MDARNDLLGLFRHPVRRRLTYDHKDQLDFYGNNEDSESFRKRYRFRKNTIENLSRYLEDDIGPKVPTNNAFTVSQRLCMALRFYATGTFQMELGDGEGASQSSMCRHISMVSKVLAQKSNHLIKFSTDPGIMKLVSTGFYAGAGSEYFYALLIKPCM